ncbi:hypothetical protein Aca07nite_60520 [Actinoplanes capillaceus]|uniref:Response regulatory domain-containing protein n=1 Tax=Actinoplanes campanulatus TaxID=113559 RepID=A0ABQ3WRA4_9ACTN|nr:hypothetical protein Aca07nite_60520 [Actinoplanes capillaceus]
MSVTPAERLIDREPGSGHLPGVLIADDQGIVRAGLSTILNGRPGLEVVGQAADGRTAVALARRLRPNVCLFDIRMPVLDGIEATRLLAGPDVPDPIGARNRVELAVWAYQTHRVT